MIVYFPPPPCRFCFEIAPEKIFFFFNCHTQMSLIWIKENDQMIHRLIYYLGLECISYMYCFMLPYQSKRGRIKRILILTSNWVYLVIIRKMYKYIVYIFKSSSWIWFTYFELQLYIHVIKKYSFHSSGWNKSHEKRKLFGLLVFFKPANHVICFTK